MSGFNRFVFSAYQKFNPVILSILESNSLLELYDDNGICVYNYSIQGIIASILKATNDERLDQKLERLGDHIQKLAALGQRGTELISKACLSGRDEIYQIVQEYYKPGPELVNSIERSLREGTLNHNVIGIAGLLPKMRRDVLYAGKDNLN